ncbi:hypothetical protein MCEMAEM4_01425 [Burkholderiaceae bacterium]
MNLLLEFNAEQALPFAKPTPISTRTVHPFEKQPKVKTPASLKANHLETT